MNTPQQKITEAWDKLPLAIREAIVSDETTKQIAQICKENNLSESQTAAADELVGDVLWGFISLADLPGELETKLKIDNQTALVISLKIKDSILEKLGIGSVNLISNAGADETSKSSPLIQRVPLKEMPAEISSEKLKTAFRDDSPFIIHAEEEMKTAASGVSRRDLVRPSFYQPGAMENVAPSKPVTARVEVEGLARESGKAAVPLTARTATPQPRVVHYSELKTPLDPFAGAASAPESKKGNEKPEVHPNNIINLKDLPK